MSMNHSTVRIWWSNAIFFTSVHIAALAGIYYRPIWTIPRQTLLLTVILWQTASAGITVGYHRLYSHKTFRVASFVKGIFAVFGASACQGSIKWWAVRHRLHHRYTDDPLHDPYAATNGLLWAHVGWIFFKSRYERMNLIDCTDLENDKVAKFQHRYYVPLMFITAFIAPISIGVIWDEALSVVVWACLVKCLLVWHCTFLINSLAHWDGIQPYSDENTSRTNLLLAIFTCGEGNHNFHAFPYDFRSGPTTFEWDPSKWIILGLYYLGLATGLRRARKEDLEDAKLHMSSKGHHPMSVPPIPSTTSAKHDHPTWTIEQARVYANSKVGTCLLVLDETILDVTGYLGEHPGGARVLRQYALSPYHGDIGSVKGRSTTPEMWKDATWAFMGGLNVHSRAAKNRLEEYTIATLILESEM